MDYVDSIGQGDREDLVGNIIAMDFGWVPPLLAALLALFIRFCWSRYRKRQPVRENLC